MHSHSTRRSLACALLLGAAVIACTQTGADGPGGGNGGSGGSGGSGGAEPGGGNGGGGGTGGESGRGGAAGATGGSGGAMGPIGGTGGPGAPDAAADASVARDSAADSGPRDLVAPAETIVRDTSLPDLPAPASGPMECGAAGQVCCGANTCTGGARPVITPGGPTEHTVLHLRASGRDPYAYFMAMKLWPIDGPDADYITDTGSSFLFVLHQDGAEETVSSGALRQRNELTVNPSNPTIYKALKGDLITYAWRFRLDRMNAQPTWCDIFQVKQHGTTGTGPYLAFEAHQANFNLKTARNGIVATTPLANVMNTWIDARVTIRFDDAGSLEVTMKKVDDGSAVLSYKSTMPMDFADTTVDFTRPKWGFYRNKKPGAGEAAIHYNDMRIIRHTPGGPCTCAR